MEQSAEFGLSILVGAAIIFLVSFKAANAVKDWPFPFFLIGIPFALMAFVTALVTIILMIAAIDGKL